MSEQIKADFARAQKFIKAEQYAQALAILMPHKDHPRIAALIADLGSKQKPASKGVVGTILWLTLVVVVGVIAGVGGYVFGENQTANKYELPLSMEQVFVGMCTATYDLSAEDCSDGIRAKWFLYRGPTQECYSQINDIPDLTEVEFLSCIHEASE